MTATDSQVRSCVLAAFYRHPTGVVTIRPDEFGKVLHELGVDEYPRHKVRRALDSLAHNADPTLRRLRRTAKGDGVRVYELGEKRSCQPRRAQVRRGFVR